MTTDDADAGTHEHDRPSVRQLLDAATGDREAEGKALADRAHRAGEEDVTEEDAELAVKRVHGDMAGGPHEESDIASPEDAEEIEEHRDR